MAHIDGMIGFIGGGNMAHALIGGVLEKGGVPDRILVIDPNQMALTRLETEHGVQTALAPDARLQHCRVLVLAVKPQHMRDAVTRVQPFLGQALVLSIAAGIRAHDLARWLGGYRKIVRSMPNTPALIGHGVTGLFALDEVSVEQRAVAQALLDSVGSTIWFDKESDLDSVTALSGSGPAYVFYFIEALQEAGAALGLPAEAAARLAMETVYGAAQLAMHSSDPVALLRERVTSKGGTTHAALGVLQERDLKGIVRQAIQAAAQRGAALGEEFGAQ